MEPIWDWKQGRSKLLILAASRYSIRVSPAAFLLAFLLNTQCVCSNIYKYIVMHSKHTFAFYLIGTTEIALFVIDDVRPNAGFQRQLHDLVIVALGVNLK